MSATTQDRPAELCSAGSGKVPFDRKASSYLFAAVRSDLPPAIQGVQLCHAVARASAQGGLQEDTRFVLVRVPDQVALFDLAHALFRDGLNPCVFEEPDHGIGASALALPVGSSRHGRRFAALPLWSGSG